MTTEIKEGDLYSYANVYVESHGFLIKTNEDYSYEVALCPIRGVELQIGTDGQGYSLNLFVKPEDIDKLIYDQRGAEKYRSYILVYRSGRSREEVLEMIRPQLIDVMEKRVTAFEELVFNANEMLNVLQSDRFNGDHICSTVPGHEVTA